MSLETEIKNLRTSIDKLIDVLGSTSLPAQPAVPSSPSKAESPSPSAAQAAPAPEQPEPQAPAVPDYESEVKPKILALGEKSRKAVVELLAKYGVKKGPELKPEQYAAVVVDLDAALKDEPAAEQEESLV